MLSTSSIFSHFPAAPKVAMGELLFKLHFVFLVFQIVIYTFLGVLLSILCSTLFHWVAERYQNLVDGDSYYLEPLVFSLLQWKLTWVVM